MNEVVSESARLHTYRYGEAVRLVGVAVGVTHYLPRGVRSEDHAAKGYFDVWLPLLAPSRELLASFHEGKVTFPQFAKRYRAEMRRNEPRQAIRLLAAMARIQPVHLGCFCTDAAHCHRLILRELVIAAAAELPVRPIAATGGFFSPACSMPEIED